MDSKRNRLNSMLFYCSNTETVTRKDFQKPLVEGRKYVRKPPEKKEHKRPDVPLHQLSPNYVSNMTRWNNALPPFDLFIYPDPVHGFDPRVIQEPYVKPENLDQEKFQRLRPRLVMTPAISIDDIGDQQVRSLIVNDTYQTTQRAMQVPVAKTAFPDDMNVKSPLEDSYAPPKPLEFPRLRKPFVSPEWRMQSALWDNDQMRGYTDSTKEFWPRAVTERALNKRK